MANPLFQVSKPFDDDEHADVILRSSDNVDFKVIKGILSAASPIFKTMFRLPLPPESSTVQVVLLSEPASTLDALLRFIYPIENEACINPCLVVSALTAAKKYEMDGISSALANIVIEKCKDECQDAVEIYVYAHKHKLEEEVRLAASNLLSHNMYEWKYSAALEDISGGALFHLFNYRNIAVAWAMRLFYHPSYFGMRYIPPEIHSLVTVQGVASECRSGFVNHHKNYTVRQWWLVACHLAVPWIHAAPLSNVVFSHSFVIGVLRVTNCQCCKRILTDYSKQICNAVRLQIHFLVDKVSSSLCHIRFLTFTSE